MIKLAIVADWDSSIRSPLLIMRQRFVMQKSESSKFVNRTQRPRWLSKSIASMGVGNTATHFPLIQRDQPKLQSRPLTSRLRYLERESRKAVRQTDPSNSLYFPAFSTDRKPLKTTPLRVDFDLEPIQSTNGQTNQKAVTSQRTSADQDLRTMQTPLHLEEEVGEGLGECEILLRRLSEACQPQINQLSIRMRLPRLDGGMEATGTRIRT